MRVLLAESMGMCFGVRDALAVARRIPQPIQVTIRGQLVHNPVVIDELRARGFALLEESHEGPVATEQVLITAHGICNRERERLLAAGATLVDTTCPLVAKAHLAAVTLERMGYFVVVVGKREHVEVRGLTGDLEDFDVVERSADVRCWPHHKIGIVAQTTSIDREVATIVERVRSMNPQAEVRFENTICQPTRDRQRAVDRLLDEVDLLVVVGGRNSNNTLRLMQRARERGRPAIHVENESELVESAFDPPQIVGLTAGTSTLPETVAAVHRRLTAFHSHANG